MRTRCVCVYLCESRCMAQCRCFENDVLCECDKRQRTSLARFPRNEKRTGRAAIVMNGGGDERRNDLPLSAGRRIGSHLIRWQWAQVRKFERRLLLQTAANRAVTPLVDGDGALITARAQRLVLSGHPTGDGPPRPVPWHRKTAASSSPTCSRPNAHRRNGSGRALRDRGGGGARLLPQPPAPARWGRRRQSGAHPLARFAN